MTVEELVRDFSLERVSKSGAKFDVAKLQHFSQHYIRLRTNAQLAAHLQATTPKAAHLPAERAESLVALVRDRLTRLTDLPRAAALFLERPAEYDPTYRAKVWDASLAPALPALATHLQGVADWTHDGLQAAVKEFSASQNVKMGKLMPMLRIATTGTGEGPGVLDILAWLGKPESLERLQQGLAALA
jgi:glutamyl-tRNA synthetase